LCAKVRDEGTVIGAARVGMILCFGRFGLEEWKMPIEQTCDGGQLVAIGGSNEAM
jgi:hypothetical protein